MESYSMSTAINQFNHFAEAADFLQAQVPNTLQKPVLGIVCGSGLGDLADAVKSHSRYEVPYASIPNFPSSTGRRRPSTKAVKKSS